MTWCQDPALARFEAESRPMKDENKSDGPCLVAPLSARVPDMCIQAGQLSAVQRLNTLQTTSTRQLLYGSFHYKATGIFTAADAPAITLVYRISFPHTP